MWMWVLVAMCAAGAAAQDSSTGALSGVVTDATGARVSKARIVLISDATGMPRSRVSDERGEFSFALLAPGAYTLRVEATSFATATRDLRVEVGGEAEVELALRVAGSPERAEVSGDAAAVETQSSAVSTVVDSQAIESLPLNGRRFTELALLTPGVTQDPRGLSSGAIGDLSFGGLRGFHTSFLVDGSDNNNSFFAQARGRYRAPYQFSNEVVQEFRVSSNSYAAELGRSAGAVVNIVTKSGSNVTHGSAFWYLRDGRVAAVHPYVRKRYPDRQNQFGATIGGPIRRNQLFYYLGFDQHIFHVPEVVQFVDGTTRLVPGAADYEVTDQQLVADTAARLSTLAGQFRTSLAGNAGFAKLDYVISPQHVLSARVNLSRFSGSNNVFFDPASPITNFGVTANGEEQVQTESAHVSLTSALSPQWDSHLRAQFSRDDQGSRANSKDAQTKIRDVIAAIGRSSILPRNTNEKKVSLAETLSYDRGRHAIKLGGDAMFARIYNYFPRQYGGQYIFDTIKVNAFTFVPQTVGGLSLTPLRAFAHDVPRYYIQDFGSAVTQPDSNDYALFAQDTVRVNRHLTINGGVRYDLQTFREPKVTANALWPDAGHVPHNATNFAPRLGFSASIGGEHRPLVIRGGYGMFYAHIPQIYASSAQADNGLNRAHLFLDNKNFFDRQIFPAYPDPLVSCTAGAVMCSAPAGIAGFVTSEISSFARDFRTPYAEQANLSLEKEIAKKTSISASYLFVSGKHLIRARDVNLPNPVEVQYPVFDDSGAHFTGDYYTLSSFSQLRFTKSVTCVFPPCIDRLERPISSVGAINEYESASSSIYHGLTISAQRRYSKQLYLRVGYTFAKALDQGQDALVAGRPGQVQNTFAPNERGLSTTDQRHRVVLAWSAEPNPFGAEQPTALRALFNSWLFSGVVAVGSGRPVNARITGDANGDGNTENDRLPGYRRNAFTGPDYASTDIRVTRKFELHDRMRLELSGEAFNLMNRVNKRVDITDDGFTNVAADFVPLAKSIGASKFAGHFRRNSNFLVPTNAYAPRQVQVSLRLKF